MRKNRWHSVRTACGPGLNTNTSRDAKQENAKQDAREVVDGVRRVWGTIMKGSSCRTVLSTLQKLTTVAENLKKRGNSEVRWWFLIRGTEPSFQTLEQEWESVENSTSWRLEQCYRPVCPTAQNLQPDGEGA